jgi:hypothetical protein
MRTGMPKLAAVSTTLISIFRTETFMVGMIPAFARDRLARIPRGCSVTQKRASAWAAIHWI